MLFEASENTRAPSCRRSVLLLQGPVGPFFSELEGTLRAAGHLVQRVAFNPGDNLFSSRVHRPKRVSLNLNEWESWLRFELSCRSYDCFILFGSSRPAHKMARQIAHHFNIKVLSLEEGYLRSGYVTVELDGNNQHSRLTSWRSQNHQSIDAGSVPSPMAMSSSFIAMSVWGAIYYLARGVFSTASDEHLFHRPSERVVPLAWNWCSHMARRGVARITEFPTQRHLRRKPGYILVPLQVSSDSQIQLAARGWTAQQLVDACLNSLAKSDANQRVVFKLHPLECKNALITRLIHRKAKSLGLRAERFAVLNSGRIGELTAHSSGMVVINSTSGFSALHHNKPLLVLGDAVFRHDEIATTGNSEEDIRIFFQHRQAKASDVIEQFFDTLKSQCLVPGDFYVAAGRKTAVQHIIRKLEQLPLSSANIKEANV
jgi:capsular polysaccharide export protein